MRLISASVTFFYRVQQNCILTGTGFCAIIYLNLYRIWKACRSIWQRIPRLHRVGRDLMKIKQVLNDKINSFEFYFDLFKANIMEKVLRLFCLEDIYVSVYGLLSNYAVIDHCKNITDKSHIIRARKGIFDMAFGLNSGNISLLFSILGKDLDEVMIWSRERDWERYVAEESEFPAFILHRKSDLEKICDE